MQLHNSDTCRTHRHHIVHRYVASSVLQSARDVPGGGKSYLFKVALKAGFDMPISSMVGFVQQKKQRRHILEVT